MRGSRMAGWVVVTAAAAMLVNASPGSARRADPTNVDVTPSGSLAISWQGDPARGCAGEGLCGVRGELILRSFGTMGFGSSGGLSELPINVSGAVRVRDDSQSPPGECVDLVGN